MDPKKVEAIKNRIFPKNVKQLQQFLGLANYYRRFINNFSKTAKPLFTLLKKDVPFSWTIECEKAFIQLKKALIDYPVLRPADLNRPFILYTDCSGYCAGVILSQRDDDGNEYVVSYASKMLSNRNSKEKSRARKILSY